MRNFILVVWLLWLGLDHYANGQATIKTNLLDIASSALAKNPTIVRSEYAVRSAESNLQIQRSAFDLNSFSELLLQTNQYVLPGADPRTALVENSLLKSNTLNMSAGVRQRLRTGQLTEVSMNYRFSNNNYPLNTYNQPISTFLGNNAGTLNLSLTQPLLRGRGRRITTALEQSYTLYVDNAKSNNEFANSYELWQIATAYWGYTAAYKNLDIYKQSENRLRNVLSVTEELIKGDKKPAGDLVQIRADLASQERLTLMAEQELYAAKIFLGKVVGFSPEESQLLDIPQNDFPSIAGSAYRPDLEKADFVRVAKERRADLRAAKQGNEALERQYQFAQNNVKPQLDLTGFISYGGVSTGNGMTDALSSFSNYQGRTVGTGAKLTFTFPVNNNLAKGNLVKSYVAMNDQNVVVNNLLRTLELDISNDLNYLNNSVAGLQKAEEVLNYNQDVYNNERIKFQSGLTTMLNLILFQDRLTSAQLKYLQAYRQFANAIINLRHDTGTLIRSDAKGFTIDQNVFYTIPDPTNN
ncbi:hypothetical protein F5984_25660 [Rudanella paleaurantiibacter]|uniref:TolC family protein n=1 Tax=Rudanella paleaurantiibacter TaxID=2614655 RepID=A0A7J5TS22_9BACT|nr:TolC family protein [Rudanella paleaurantiibacter]KAB7725710.1 hypothetical protein F5984_25660 [Rudanella paleaurantiibacter]